ncbi:MAG: hypothetical protein KDA89_23920 [Planctomycetaceae bacterium]|nr:hypothetical protein [Planctomycetaceae bacterium]
MKIHPVTRRQFTRHSAAILGTVAGMSPLFTPEQSVAEDVNITEKRLVRLGINALARAPEMSYFADGHRGAALVSAHLMCVDNHLDDAAAARIVELFDLNWASAKLCQPFPEGDIVPDAAEQVGKALAEANGTLREVGHDAIFAMLAIKAFRMLPETATKERVDGVCQLLRSIKPWRDDPPDEAVDPPPFSDLKATSRYVLKEASDAIDRFVGFGQGFAGHMLTFGQSLVELAAMGDIEWAESCRTAFRKYVTVTRIGPKPDDRKYKDHAFSQLRPTDAEYWQKRGDKTLGIGHVFKYPYAYYELVAHADDPQLTAEFESRAWHVF